MTTSRVSTLSRQARRFTKFCIVGASSAFIHMLVLQVVVTMAGSTAWAVVATGSSLGFLCAVVNGFYWNRRWTFRQSHIPGAAAQFGRFFAVAATGLVLNYGLMYLLYEHLALFRTFPYAHLVSQLIATVFVSFYNFTAHSLWTFTHRR
jgi:putative flippase GtrA